MNEEEKEFFDVIGTETVPEYTFVSIRHPWGLYCREVICPDGKRVNHEHNLNWVLKLHKEIRKGRAKYKAVTKEVSLEEALRMSREDNKMKKIVKRLPASAWRKTRKYDDELYNDSPLYDANCRKKSK